MTQQASSSPATENKHTLGWIFGVLFLLGGLGMFTSSFLSGLTTLLVGLLLLPPSRKWVEQKINRTLSRPVLIVVSLVLFSIGGAALSGTTETASTPVNSNTVAQDTKPTNVDPVAVENKPQEQAVAEPPKEESTTDKLWTALDQSIKTRKGYNIQWNEADGVVILTKQADLVLDENDIVRKTYADVVKYGQAVFAIDPVKQVQVVYTTEFTDQYGKKNTDTAVEIWFNKEEFQKYDWNNLNYQPVWQQMENGAARYYVHPAINKGLSKDKLFLAL